ncbi:MAG: M28 family peptidase [Bacteroidetes bacterium]|nr:M28 family peptidase [Bacteroidota bacterium]
MYKKILVLLLIIPTLGIAQSKKEKKAKLKEDKITYDHIEAHIKYLASDKLEGRRTGTMGEVLAMEYISNQFEKYHVKSAGTNGYIQEFSIDEGKQMADHKNYFLVNGDSMELRKEYFPLSFTSNATISGNVSPSVNERGEPWFFDLKYLLEDNAQNPHFDVMDAIKKEVQEARDKKATALIIYNSTSITDNVLYNKNDTTAALGIPVLYITHEGMQKYFNDITSYFSISCMTGLEHVSRKARNVIAFINNNAPTTVIIGGHFDHLGYGEDNNSLDGYGQIHNGADDNASGTAAVIELSRILQNSKAKNNNYLFIAFSGEELGLFGSKYWLEHPSINISPNYMINMDMIGRYDTARKLTIGGYGTSPDWGNIFSVTPDKNLVIKLDSSGSGPSDHASFYRDSIPVLFFFTNSHPDYHKATDDWDKINYSGEVEIIDYIVKLIEATDSKGKLSFAKTRDMEMRSVSLPVTLGVIPDYGYTGTGMRIDGVSKGKIAEHIGLKAGDVLLQLGEYKFVDVMSYMTALQHFKKGDKTTLHILRGTEEKIFELEF